MLISHTTFFLFRDAQLKIYREIHFAIRSIYGLGFRKAFLVISKIGIGYPFMLKRINQYKFAVLSSLLKEYIISDARIKRDIEFNISKLISIEHIKGMRHRLNLPVHGQRTRTNASTQRLKKRFMRLVKPKKVIFYRRRKNYKKNIKKNIK